MKEDAARRISSFVCKVRLKDATYEMQPAPEMAEKYGLPENFAVTVLVPEWLEWGYVPYLEPDQCCCHHKSESCPFEVDNQFVDESGFSDICHASTMCRACRHQWEEDYEVVFPDIQN